MKKILFFNSNMAWGGGEKWHYTTALYLKAKGYQCHFITNQSSDLYHKVKEEFPCHEVELSNLSFLNPLTHLKIKKVIVKLEPDTIILNLPIDLKLCVPSASSLGIANIIYRRGMPKDIKNTFLNRYLFKRLTKIIANSEVIRQSLIKNMPSNDDKLHVIYNGVKLQNKVINSESPYTLGNLGRLVDQKGQAHLIEIAKILKEKNFPFKLLIGGKGPNFEKLQSIIQKYSLQNHIFLEGHVNPQDFFQRIDLFVFSSLFEGSANALLESLSYQVPAVAFNISSNPEIVNETNGALVQCFDHTAFAQQIIHICTDKAQYESLIQGCKTTIETKFDHDLKMKELMDIL